MDSTKIINVNNKLYKFIERKLSHTDNIVGLLKGFSKLELNEAIQIFYTVNPKKNYKVYDKVLIPVSKEEIL